MPRSPRLWSGLSGALLATCALLSRRSLALDPPAVAASPSAAVLASASASVVASASASVAASASARSGPKGSVLFFPVGVIPTEKSPAPTAEEWKQGEKVELHRPGFCDMKRVREWIRVDCADQGKSVAVVAGPFEGFKAQVPAVRADMTGSPFHFVFPLRPGERRMITLLTMARGGYGGDGDWGTSWGATINTQWWDGEGPILAVN